MSRDFFAPCQITVSPLPRPFRPDTPVGQGIAFCGLSMSRETRLPTDDKNRSSVPPWNPACLSRAREKQTVLTLKYFFEIAGLALLAAATVILLQDLYRLYQQSTLILNNQPRPEPVRPRWRAAGRITGVALGVLLTGLSIQAVPAASLPNHLLDLAQRHIAPENLPNRFFHQLIAPRTKPRDSWLHFHIRNHTDPLGRLLVRIENPEPAHH